VRRPCFAKDLHTSKVAEQFSIVFKAVLALFRINKKNNKQNQQQQKTGGMK